MTCSPNELLAIYQKNCTANHYQLNSAAKQTMLTKLQDLYQQRDQNFGNGRLVRNLFERTIEKQASRLAKLTELNQESIVNIVAEDIP